MKKIYAVIDTNVIVSALYSTKTDAATVLILDFLTIGKIIPLVNQEILAEYADVLSRKKFNFSSDKIEKWMNFFNEYGIQTIRSESQETFTDEKDMVFYEVALSVEGSFLVTGNIKHFPKTPIVVTPSEMIQILLSKNDK